jgi:hypothetical protein
MKVGPDFVATNFTFYDCSSYQSCTACVSSPFPCDWCVGGHRCTHDTGENCRNDILVTGVSSVGPSIRSGPGFCPRINATAGGTTEGKSQSLSIGRSLSRVRRTQHNKSLYKTFILFITYSYTSIIRPKSVGSERYIQTHSSQGR